ncbi:MAG TPA: SHOCT domain-containing protein, partial [Acidimicrobiales bacterium]
GALLLVLFAALLVFGGRSAAAPAPTVTYPTVLHRPTAEAATMADGLTRLADLKDRGLLSDDEWQRAKALYLGKAPDHRAGDAQLLDDLYDLHLAGGLSESEFNAKKWEILERS